MGRTATPLAIGRGTLLTVVLLLGSAGFGTPQSVVGCVTVDCALAPNQVRAATAKISERKEEFAAALRQFVVALAGFGGIGGLVQSSLESMDAALVRWDEAIREFETALKPSARNADAHLALGMVYLGRHRVNDALREFGEAVRLKPQRAEGLLRTALAYSLAGKASDAALAFQKASVLAPDNPVTSYELARQRMKMGEAKEAESARRRFRESLQKQLAARTPSDTVSAPFERVGLLPQTVGDVPLFPPALYSSGFALLTQGAYGEAIVRFRQAAALDSLTDSADANDRFAQGESALRQGDLPSALSHLRSAVESAPGRAEAHRVLGTAYWADGQPDHSIEQYKAALRVNANDERSWMALADVFATIGQFTQAEQVLKEALQVLPGSGHAHYGLGRLYQSLARYPEAVRQLEEAATFNPIIGVDSLYEMIGSIYVGQADFDRAAEAYEKRIDVNPNNADAHRKLAEVHLQGDRDDQALAEYMAALLIDPRDSAAHGGVAQVHLRAGRYAEAADASRRASDLDPTLKEARYALGTALMRLGQVEEGAMHMEEFRRLQDEAVASARRKFELERIKHDAAVSLANSEYEKAAGLLRQAIAYESTMASTYLALGFALLEAGHHEEAIANLQKAAQLESGADVHRYLGEAYAALGRFEESRSESEQYRQMIERVKKERLRKMSGSS